MFSNAIVRRPGRSIVRGLTTASLGLPDYQKALDQHGAYVRALEDCGLNVRVLEADEDLPDSTFVEDTALLTPCCAIITNPGAESRRGETAGMRKVIGEYFSEVEEIQPPGTVDAGDIMMVGEDYYIGLSSRSNRAGAQQVIDILRRYGMNGSLITLEKVLHLKTGVSYIENNNLVASGEFLSDPEFGKFNIIEVPEDERYAANCVWINGRVLVPEGYPGTRDKIVGTGYPVLEVDVSEFRKLDGGLSCLSLRF